MAAMKSPSGVAAIRGVRLLALLLLIVGASLAIHGYHYGIEDEAIYLPAIKAHLNPALYPRDAIFFQAQTRSTLFDELVAASSRRLHLPVDWTVFVYYLGTLLAFYAALWVFASCLFPETEARLGGVLLVAAMLTLPVAGTCIYLVDQHLHPRTLAAALILLAAARLAPRAWGKAVPTREFIWAALLIVAAALIHAQMAFYGVLFLALLLLPLSLGVLLVPLAGIAPLLLAAVMTNGDPAWQEAARTRDQHYLLHWQWYEWLGAVAPIFVMWGIARLARWHGLLAAEAVAMRVALLAACGFVAGCVITIPTRMERLTPYQPLRTLHLTYVVMILMIGALLAELVLKQKLWRWFALLLPVAAVMSFAQFESFPDSRHVEWPGRSADNQWVEAFNWIKANTPVDAYFALNPHYMSSEGEDFHGFRGLAERGQLADWDKDPGVVALYPKLAPRWSREVHALDNWNSFTAEDFFHLHDEFGVDWAVLSGGYAATRPIPLSDCPYHNRNVVVCKIR
jgi:hypothetical protein